MDSTVPRMCAMTQSRIQFGTRTELVVMVRGKRSDIVQILYIRLIGLMSLALPLKSDYDGLMKIRSPSTEPSM